MAGLTEVIFGALVAVVSLPPQFESKVNSESRKIVKTIFFKVNLLHMRILT